ncbi:MAG: Hsp20/alpha crystallin family protein [Promethearchaeota archaeon]
MDDIFDRFNKRIRRFFEDWIDFSSEFEDIFEDLDENFEIRIPKGKTSKNYSISYRWQTGMDKPEIIVKGDATEDDIQRFLKGIQAKFGRHALSSNDFDVKMLEPGEGEELESNEEYRYPDGEIQSGNSNAIVTLEMPGVGKDDVKIDIDGKKVTIIGEKGDIKYKRKFTLKFEPSEHEITANNGIIEITFKK